MTAAQSLIDPRQPAGDNMPDLQKATVAELRHWLGVEPERWAKAAAVLVQPGVGLDAQLRSWFAAAIEAGRIDGATRRGRGLGEPIQYPDR